ncbi:YdcF family protein [Sphingomonas sp. HITSZ_GF]|uniref:YdcF family protein n=1 Tax=Sphingomonas sp. HITSZ_GF TaxID=3037247 RepID=UPI00240D1A25|nr:YdcF family protein [Sphingomonas sp. HITSZ_GF]MDG2535399.1 YdcF family protein [Sphingomonas sp. HITSZ_GF]
MRLRLATALLGATLGASTLPPAPPASAQHAPALPDRGYAWVHSGSAVQDENFYLLTLLERVPEYRAAILASPRLARIKAERAQRIAAALAGCGAESARCRVEAMLWRPEEIDAVGAALATDPRIAGIAARHLRPSGAFQRHAAKGDADLIRAAWADAAAGMNRIYRVFGLAEAPRYPKIDSGDFKPDDPAFGRLLAEAADIGARGMPADASVFAEPLQFALTLLYLNDRELVRISTPLERRENAAAVARVAGTAWSRYPYASILVLGSGPGTLGTGISAIGKLRTMRAAQLYREGKAPFLIVSGGAVHPVHTDIFEAMSMKRELVERYGIPASAVLIEPAARHTTTNFRNAARLIFRYGLPMDRPSIVTSSASHITGVASDGFGQRLDAELGYQPIVRGRQLGPYEMEWRALPAALHRDAQDPLDP